MAFELPSSSTSTHVLQILRRSRHEQRDDSSAERFPRHISSISSERILLLSENDRTRRLIIRPSLISLCVRPAHILALCIAVIRSVGLPSSRVLFHTRCLISRLLGLCSVANSLLHKFPRAIHRLACSRPMIRYISSSFVASIANRSAHAMPATIIQQPQAPLPFRDHARLRAYDPIPDIHHVHYTPGIAIPDLFHKHLFQHQVVASRHDYMNPHVSIVFRRRHPWRTPIVELSMHLFCKRAA